ncbi:MAG TPA: DUF4845 domain-containing protein [Burkholderiales bacterium]|jgi:hypothetical protein
MRKKQLGVSLGGLMAVSVVLIAVALIGIKLAPSYIEFYSIKKVINATAGENKGASVATLRNSYDLRRSIDGIETITGKDLEITKDGSDVVISASYRKEIPLVANIGVYIEFHTSSKQ